MKRLVLLLACVSTAAMADPVADHDAALTAAAVAFDAVKTERDATSANIARVQLERDTAQAALNAALAKGVTDQATIAALQSTLTATQAALAACKVAPGCYTAPVPVPPPPPPPSPPPPTTAEIPVLDPATGFMMLPKIADNFDINAELMPAWETGVIGAIPASSSPDVVGAFRFDCDAGQISYDDPIVYPGQVGRSHLHQFYGNTSANAYSTYSSLRTSGNSSCMSPVNRSAYWQPAMMNGKGQVVKPAFVSIYYKRRVATDPYCNLYGQKGCVDIPRGLRFVFGYNVLNPSQFKTGSAYFNCSGSGSVPGHYADITLAAKNCAVGGNNKLGFIISAPECWDGKNLDSADHRSHVSYSAQDGKGHSVCPATHPYIIPTFTLGSWYATDADMKLSVNWDGATLPGWHLSSDEAMPGMNMPMKPGTTIHADWFGAWSDSVMAIWHANCINKKLNCSGGDLGSSKQIKVNATAKLLATPRIVPAPARPVP